MTTERMPERLRERLNQGEWWRTKQGQWLRIADMQPSHRRNTAAMLLRNATAYEFRYDMDELMFLGGNVSEHAEDAIMEAQARRMENPHRWIRETKLYQALLDGLPKFDGQVPDELMAEMWKQNAR